MKRLLFPLLILIMLIVAAAKFLVFPAQTAHAAKQQVFGACISNVPQDWGAFRGGSEQSGLAFEDRQGTLRFVTSFPCNGVTPPVALEVRRTPSKN